jgi:ATP-dependent RNA helicase RhlE
VARAGHKTSRIHADRTQGQRRQALDGFKDGTYRVLIATDIAARGIDVADIGHVVNFDLPHVAEDYVHRVGRTARAEASGRASAFCSPEEVPLLRDIEKLTRNLIPRAEVPRDTEVFKSESARAAEGRATQGVPPHRRPGSGGPSRRTETARKRGVGHGHGHNRGSHSPPPAPRSEARSEGGGHPARKATLVGSWKPKRR